MKKSTFAIETLATKEPAKKRQAKPKEEKFPATTAWGREALRRIEALHKAMDGKKLA